MDTIDLSSFGAVLKTFRTRKRLTQQQLAAQLGVGRNTIGSWERGDALPASKGQVLELARRLCLNKQEMRQLLEASLTALTPHWLIPLPRNPFFTGRAEVLEALHAQLSTNQTVALTQPSALHGLGGVGKTQTALEYAYRYALGYNAVFWIGSETEEQIIASLLHIADVLQLPEQGDKDQQRVIAAVQRWLATHGQWLLIWDNVEDLALLNRFLPSARSGAILITTRSQILGTLARGMDLLPMQQEEGTLFLLRRAKILAPDATSTQMHQLATRMPAHYAAAEELVEAVGGLPLALDQAGAYLEATQCGLPSYLKLFRTHRAVLLQQRGQGSWGHPESVSTTFILAITAIAQRHPAVWDLLRVCAFLQPDAIPEELFLQGAEYLGATLEAVCHDGMEWDQVISLLCAYSLLSRQPEERTLSMHRLVQVVLLDSMAEVEQKAWTRRVIEMLDAVFPDVWNVTRYAAWKRCEQLLPHALPHLQQTGVASESLAFASLAHKTACYLLRRGRYAEAEPLFQHALQIREQTLGPEHPEVASTLNNMAILSMNQSKFAEAEVLFQHALQIREQTLGPEHPEVATTLNCLAILSYDQGKFAEAEVLFQRALQTWEQTLGPGHLRVATALNNLAELYWKQGKFAEAEPLVHHSLQIREQALASEHPDMGETLSILANLLREQEKYSEAEPLYQQALQIQERAFGPEHRRVASLLNELAECYRMQGRDMEAEPSYWRALQGLEQTLGPEHPDVADPLNGLANLFRDRGTYTKAEPLYQRALSIREQYLGQHHPDTAETLHDLALLRQKQGNLNEAMTLAERTLSIRTQSLGDVHPKTVATRALYDQLYQKQAYAKEEALWQK